MSPKIKYDKEAEIMSIRVSDKKSVDSDVKNNVVVDYDEKGDIVNIDIMKIGVNEFKEVRQAMPAQEPARA